MGSKSTPQTTTKTQVNTIPAWLQAAGQGLISDENGLQPLAPYTGEGVAPLTANQNQALGLASSGVGAPQGALSPAFGGAANAMNFAAPQVTAGGINRDTTSLLDPYTATAVDGVNQRLNQQRVLQGNQIDAGAAMDHAFGSDRNAVAHALNDQTTDQNIAQTDAAMLNDQFNRAQGTALAAGQGNQNAALQGAGINLSGVNSLGSLAGVLQGLNTSQLNGLLTTGGAAQQTGQAADTFNFNQYLQPWQQQLQKYGLLTSAIGSAPHDTTSNGTETSQVYSNPLAGIAGIGLGVAGLMTGNPMGAAGVAGGVSSLFGGGATSPSPTAFSGYNMTGLPGM